MDKRQTRLLDPAKLDSHLRRTSRAQTTEKPQSLRFVLSNMSAVFDVPVRQFMILGRRIGPDDNQVDIDLDPYRGFEHGVSRYHAIIQVNRGRLFVKDTSSSNGSRLNGFMMQPLKNYPLRDGDALTLGNLKVRVYFLGVERTGN